MSSHAQPRNEGSRKHQPRGEEEQKKKELYSGQVSWGVTRLDAAFSSRMRLELNERQLTTQDSSFLTVRDEADYGRI